MTSPESIRRRFFTATAVVIVGIGAASAAAASTMSSAQAAAGGTFGALAGMAAGAILGRVDDRRRGLADATRRLAAATVVLPRAVPRPHGGTLSWLLSPDSRVAPFRGRGQEMQRLLSWLEEDAPVLVLSGPAGTGKTRLAVEFAERVAPGWTVLRVTDPGALSPVELLEDIEAVARPTVVVVDLKTQSAPTTANGFNRSWVVGLLARVEGAAAMVKVLVECRGTRSQDVMRQQFGEDAAVIDAASWVHVTSIGRAEDVDRWLNEGARAICSELGLPTPKPVLWKPPHRVSMLHLQARAVVTAFGGNVCTAASLGDDVDMAAAARSLVDLERASWVPAGLVEPPDDVVERRAVSVLTLVGASTEEEAADALRRVPDLADCDSGRRHSVARKVRACYPGAVHGEWIGRVESDFIAAALHASVFGDGFLVQSLVEPALTPGQLVRCLRTLVPATATFPVLGQVVSALLAASPLKAIPEALALAGYLDDLSATDSLMADHVAEHPPTPSELAAIEPLVNPAMFRTRTTLALLRSDAAKNGEVAELLPALCTLAFWLERIGRYDEAVRTYEEAIALLRGRGQEDWIASHDLPATLAAMGGALSKLGRYEEASVAVGEAVPLFRALAVDDVVHRCNLAASLCNLSSCLSSVGRFEEAHDASEEAVRLLRPIVVRPTDSQAVNLASALSNHGVALAGMARRDESRAAYEEGIALFRCLVSESLALHGPNLAMALRNLCGMLNDHGRYEEALTAGSEAVAVLRTVVAENEGIHEGALAAAMCNLSRALDRTARYEEALGLDQERVLLLRRLVVTAPELHSLGLATALSDLGRSFSMVHRRADALASLRRSVRLFRALIDETSSADPSCELAGALCNLCQVLDGAGRSEDALPVIEEAIALLRAAADGPRTRRDETLLVALHNRAVVLEHMARLDDAIDGHFEVVRLCDVAPASVTGLRSESLRILRGLLPLAGRQEEEAITAGLIPTTSTLTT